MLIAELTAVDLGYIASLSAAVALVFKLLMRSKDEQLAEMTSQRNSYRQMAYESTAHLETLARRKRDKDGKPPVEPLLPIVPEHDSPTTRKQLDAADLQTARAKLTAATLALELPARAPGPLPNVDK